MNTKRKADLQRKLGMAPVVKPPAGLAERIKKDIPLYLDSGRERERLWKSLALDYRVAASVLLLVGAAWFGLRLMSDSGVPAEDARPTSIVRPASRIAQGSESATPPSAPLPNAAATDRAPEPIALAAPQTKTIITKPATAEARRLDAPVRDEQIAEKTTPAIQAAPAYAGAPAAPASAADGIRQSTVAGVEEGKAAPLAAPPPPPAAARDADAPVAAIGAAARVAKREATTVTATKASMAERTTTATAEVIGNRPAPQNVKQVFGLSIDDGAFARVKSAIDRGEKPPAGTVDVEALVNYFAGAPARSPHEVALDVEASQAPFEDPQTYVLRSTVDTAVSAAGSGALPDIATNAHIETAFNRTVVVSQRRIGGETNAEAESSLSRNLSVTALYEIELRPNAMPEMTVAVVRLRYRSAGREPETTIQKEVHVSDLKAWSKSSRRHRLASLSAAWGEALKQGSAAGAVAQKARELAVEQPADPRARELAAVATASSRLRNSGPTGSGR